jgi:hypothetical protein
MTHMTHMTHITLDLSPKCSFCAYKISAMQVIRLSFHESRVVEQRRNDNELGVELVARGVQAAERQT